MVYKDRSEAARILYEYLHSYKNSNSVVLAIPRGGVPIGYYLSKELNLEFDILLSKKIGHPFNPEFAIGSVSTEGVYLNQSISGMEDYVKTEIQRLQNLLKEKYFRFRGNTPPVNLEGKNVILVDDGIATGSTMFALIDQLQHKNIPEVIVAVPVGPPDTIRKLTEKVEVICPSTPSDFLSVGQFYKDFHQIDDEEVIEIMHRKTV